jgi:hypothetical protein
LGGAVASDTELQEQLRSLLNDAHAQEQIVEEFQPKLEMFRLKNYTLV